MNIQQSVIGLTGKSKWSLLLSSCALSCIFDMLFSMAEHSLTCYKTSSHLALSKSLYDFTHEIYLKLASIEYRRPGWPYTLLIPSGPAPKSPALKKPCCWISHAVRRGTVLYEVSIAHFPAKYYTDQDSRFNSSTSLSGQPMYP